MPFVAGVATVCAVGAAFGVITAATARRRGDHAILLSWLVLGPLLGSAWAFQAVRVQRRLGRGPDRASAPGLYALFIVAALVVLGFPALAIWRREKRLAPPQSYAQTGAGSVMWTVVGFLVVVLISVVLDVLGVRFVPIH